MNDERLDRLVSDADPFPGGDFPGASEELLEEIMSTPDAAVPLRRRFLVPLATAAAVTGVIAGGALLIDRPAARDTALPAPTASVSASAAAPAMDWAAMVARAAEINPRLLIDEPGWKVTSVYGFAELTGSITWQKGARSLEITWYPEEQYASYYEDRLDVSKPELSRAGDWQGNVFTYSASDFAIMLRPRDKVFAELRTSGPWTRAQFDALLPKVKRVDVQTWIKSLPPEIVTPGRAEERADQVLKGVPLPPGFDRSVVTRLGVNDPYQFTAELTGEVGCAWIEEWQRAEGAGDLAARRRAEKAMAGSHRWPALIAIVDQGDWSEAFWGIADDVAAGNPPQWYRDGLGCN